MTIGKLLQNPEFSDKFVLQKLLCLFLNCSREELWTNDTRDVDDDLFQKIKTAYRNYVKEKKPLEYILGFVEFFGRKFLVNESTLIPRPETEYMITAVSEYIHGNVEKLKGGKVTDAQHFHTSTFPHFHILLDIGTGCGVLGISVLLQNPDFFQEAIFTDLYADALAVAKKNYESLVPDFSGKVQFIESDLLDFVFEKKSPVRIADTSPFAKGDNNIILVANLPYIPEGTFDANVADNVKKYEPKPAFVGGDDGLLYYRKMFDQLLAFAKSGIMNHESCILFLEMMTRQVDILRQEYGNKMEFEEVKTFHFNIRIVKCWPK